MQVKYIRRQMNKRFKLRDVSETFVAAESHSLRPLRALMIAVLCTALIGCGPKTVWSTTVVSPDGKWVAGARTQMWSGPGVGTVASSVYLVRVDDSRHPTDIVGYMEGANSSRPQIQWRAADHLVVRVPNPANLTLQTSPEGSARSVLRQRVG
jgi:hypothetical protein